MAEGETIDHCVVGEPTSSAIFGDMIKVGRRGSINAEITVEGVQGHVAYPHRAANPVPVLIRLLAALQERVLDEGYPEFQPSNLEVTTIDVGNTASNVIPARAARGSTSASTRPHRRRPGRLAGREARSAGRGFSRPRCRWSPRISGEAFLTEPGPFTDVVAGAVEAVTGVGRSFPPPAAPPTPASSAPSARWWSSAWSARPCTRWTNGPRSPTSPWRRSTSA